MSLVLMSLGKNIFYVPQPDFDTPNFETLNFDQSFTIPSQQRLSRKPAMQFTGPGEEVVTIEGRLFPHHFGGLSTLAMIKADAEAGDPLQLVRFRPLSAGFAGDVVGKFFIRRLRQNHQKIGVTGIAHKIEFTIELVEYGDDEGAPTAQSPVPDFSFTVDQPDGINVEFT